MKAKFHFKGFLKGQFKAKTYYDLWIDADIDSMDFLVDNGKSVWIKTNERAKIDELLSHREYNHAMDVRIEEYGLTVTFIKKTPNTICFTSEYVGTKDILQITIKGEVL